MIIVVVVGNACVVPIVPLLHVCVCLLPGLSRSPPPLHTQTHTHHPKVGLCLLGLRDSVRIAGMCGLSLARDTLVATLAKFTTLDRCALLLWMCTRARQEREGVRERSREEEGARRIAAVCRSRFLVVWNAWIHS